VSRSVLRAALFIVSGVLLAGAAALALAGCSLGLALRFAVPGVILLFALVVEHWRYKPLKGRRPGPDWLATDERFVDPESGKLVAVFYKPSTGERRYVAV
jgi:hypothetical protein